MTNEEYLNTHFIYHAPKPGQPERYGRIRELARELASEVLTCPESPEKNKSLEFVQSAVMWANASIAIHE